MKRFFSFKTNVRRYILIRRKIFIILSSIVLFMVSPILEHHDILLEILSNFKFSNYLAVMD